MKRLHFKQKSTAILPLGKAKELPPAEGMTRGATEYVTISDVEWFKNEGKPLDKPRGSELLIDPEATAKYGIKDENGVMQPRVVVMQFDIADPELLAEKAYLELDKLINPQVNYTFSANDMSVQLAQMGLEEQPVEVGDVCYVIDNNVNPPIVQEVVIRRIAGNPDDRSGMQVEIGKPVSSFVDDNGNNSFTGGSMSGGSGGSGGGIQDGDTVNALTIINGTVTNLRVITGSIKNLTADVATIEELTATTGKNTDGTLVTAQSFIKGADLSLTDEWQRVVVSGVAPANTVAVKFVVRAQNNGTFYFAQPMLSRGTIASVWKPHTDELISDGAIDNNKIADNTIQSGKLFLDEILASRAFIEKFRAVEIDANQITVNKITSDQLDVAGIVSFVKNPSIFGEDMEWIFDTTADQTWINGGAIWANSVTADKINAKGLKVETADKVTAFQVFDKASADASDGEYLEGDVLITGTLKSSNFDEATNVGYKITKDGDVHINNAIIRGDVLLPSAGITNFGGAIGGKNLLTGTSAVDKSYSTGQYYANIMGKTMTLSSLGLKAGDVITLRVYIKATGTKGARARISHYYGTDGANYTTELGNIIPLGSEGYSTISVTLRSDAHEKGVFVGINSADTSTETSATGTYREPKLEVGNTASQES